MKRKLESIDNIASEWEEVSNSDGPQFSFNVRTGDAKYLSSSDDVEQTEVKLERIFPLNSSVKGVGAILKHPYRRWVKSMSTRHHKPYWTDLTTGKSSWIDPAIISPNDPTLRASERLASSQCHRELMKLINTEREQFVVNETQYPRLRTKEDIPHLVNRLRAETASKDLNQGEFFVIFTLRDDDTALFTRAIQEEQILKTRLKLRDMRGIAIDLPSFWEVWQNRQDFRHQVLTASDPYEATWTLQKKFSYKLATTFMPGYAKAMYEYNNARRVLDPCAGWGDRLTGASVAACVERYVAFDPNRSLRPGYTEIMQHMGHELREVSETALRFSNGFEVHSLPFEQGALALADQSFDLVFTSPPFFDYEMYSDANPRYSSWIDEFYRPLFFHSSRCVVSGGIVAIHVGDTSAGQIEKFLHEEVHKFTPLRMIGKVGLKGMVSDKIRTVWIFRKSI
jgi:hypothetical protein